MMAPVPAARPQAPYMRTVSGPRNVRYGKSNPSVIHNALLLDSSEPHARDHSEVLMTAAFASSDVSDNRHMSDVFASDEGLGEFGGEARQ